MGKRRWITAGELMSQLEADPKWVTERDARQASDAEKARLIALDESSIIVDLQEVGVSASSVYDFVGKRLIPSVACPVLVRHLKVEHHSIVRECLIRALGEPGARETAFEPLCAAYRDERDPHMRWVIANALSGMARLDELTSLPGIQEYAGLFA